MYHILVFGFGCRILPTQSPNDKLPQAIGTSLLLGFLMPQSEILHHALECMPPGGVAEALLLDSVGYWFWLLTGNCSAASEGTINPSSPGGRSLYYTGKEHCHHLLHYVILYSAITEVAMESLVHYKETITAKAITVGHGPHTKHQ